MSVIEVEEKLIVESSISASVFWDSLIKCIHICDCDIFLLSLQNVPLAYLFPLIYFRSVCVFIFKVHLLWRAKSCSCVLGSVMITSAVLVHCLSM